ncbi:MAG: 2-amino-4-hydroxy-6-hydroxymethyldihydropteridine diphosphokinase [bacterium]|nr:2-amino-4-hydroxy-6-hydroxymethyldihydropteridine diphosphokinase [bacterium]
MSDTIWLTGITAHAYHGVFSFEREQGQRFVLDVGYELDTREPARTDSVRDAVSYADVADALHRVLTSEPANLVETVAERMAAAVLAFPGVRAATVVLHKPEAPVSVPFADVSLTIRRTPLTVVPLEPVTVALGLGGNVGDVEGHLRSAVGELREVLDEVAVGPLVRTAAMTLPGSDPQSDYLNTVVTGRTRLAAREVLDLCHRLERAAGRLREVRWGPRTLDVDLLAYGDLHSDDAELALPHPGAGERAFVVVPWAAVAPGFELDGTPLAPRATRMVGEILETREEWV